MNTPLDASQGQNCESAAPTRPSRRVLLWCALIGWGLSVAGCAPPAPQETLPTRAQLLAEQADASPGDSSTDVSPDQIARGRQLWARCAACHQVGPEARHLAGPHLNALAGRVAGSLDDFRYSSALDGSELVWTDRTLDVWLAAPYRLFPGTSMNFGGIRDPADRAALIAYLKKAGTTSKELL